ncbi:MAG: ABC transporter permease [Opitutus sp.]
MRFAFRQLLSSPSFTAVAVLTMAIAIGANTALFSVMNAVMLRPLDFPDPDTIVRYWSGNPERNFDNPVIFWDTWRQISSQQTVFSHAAISVFNFATITGDGEPEQVPTLMASVDFLPMLGLTPQLGRTFSAEEDKEGAPAVALISQRLWESRFAKSRGVLGRMLILDGVPFTIIGVLPPKLPVPFNTPDVIQPRPYEVPFLTPQNRDRAGVWQMTARLKPGVTREAAEAQVLQIHERLKQANPTRLDAASIPRLRLLADEVFDKLDATFRVLVGAVAAVLLIACANITNLALARLSARQREIAIRASLGATRGTIIRQFLLESLVIAALGGALGVLMASWSIEGIRLLAGQQLPRAGEIGLDGSVLAFALGVTTVAALLAGIYPAIQASRTDVQAVLKEAGRGSSGEHAGRAFRSLLIVSEVALSMVLLACAGLLILSFVKLQRTQLGFDADGVAGGNINLPQSRYGKPELAREFYRQLQERIYQAPELAGGGATTIMPLTQAAMFTPYGVHGRPLPAIPDRPLAGIRTVTTGFFAAMGMRLQEGRLLNEEDRPLPEGPDGGPSPGVIGVCVINAQLADKLFPGQPALGEMLRFGVNGDRRSSIVGVLRNVKTAGVAQPVPDEIYFPRMQRGGNFMSVVGKARPGLRAEAVIPVLRRIVHELDPAVALANPATSAELVRQSIAVQRLMMTLLMAFAGIAALLAAVGIFSVMAYSVARRTSEIGVRMALGATAGSILRLVLHNATMLLTLGLLIGLGGALAATRLLQQTLYQVKPFDPGVFAAVAAFFAAIAVLACLIPARRAMQVDPMAALRAE